MVNKDLIESLLSILLCIYPEVEELDHIVILMVLPQWLSGVGESARKPGDAGSIPGLGSSPRGGNGNRVQYSCLGKARTEEPGGLQSMRSQTIGHD